MLPIAIASGASAASQQAIGTGVLGGMISATVLAVFFVPVFFVVVSRIMGWRDKPAPAGSTLPPDGTAPVETRADEPAKHP